MSRKPKDSSAGRPLVLAARLFHESHAFSPFKTTGEDFTILRDDEALREARRADTTLGGIVRRLERSGAAVHIALAVGGPPGGLVDHTFYEGIRGELITAARSGGVDAIALELHGAMATDLCPDVEGDLLTYLRSAVGNEVPIGVGLDLHGHVTPAMLSASDFCIACKENPHSDVVACGEKVADGILAILAGRFHPVSTLAKTRMLLQGAQETATGPLRELHDLARGLVAADPSLWDVSLYNVYRALDDIDMGQAVVVVSNGASPKAEPVAREITRGFWERRERFIDELWSIDDALIRAEERKGVERFSLADMGDRVLAGAPGDSTVIVEHLVERGGTLRAAVPVTDPVTVARAKLLGVGTEAWFDLGGRFTPGFKPLRVFARVLALSDGVFRMRGPYLGGEESSLGETATLRIDDRLTIVVTTRPGFTHDPEAFEAMGALIADQDIVVVKSGYHFKLNFDGLATPLLLRTPGIGYYTPGQFAWRRGTFWPEHDVSEPCFGPVVFDPLQRDAHSRSGAVA